MELGVQYVISLKIICSSARWKDLLLRNKFGETVLFVCLFVCLFIFFWGGGCNILADIFVFLYF